MTTASSKRKKLPHYHEIQVSKEDLTLVLAGFKTLHYFSDDKGIRVGSTVLLTHGRGEDKIIVPIVIDSSKVVVADTVLTPEETKATGRYVTGEYKHPIGTRDSARNLERAARLAAEPKLPAFYHAADISGGPLNSRVSRMTFHVKTAEPLKPKDAKRFRGYLRNAYSQLAPLVQEAHTYEFPRLGKDASGKPVPLPAIPEDMGMVRAVRFMTKKLNTSSLNTILSELSLPGTISSRRNPGLGAPDYKGNADTTIDGIGLGRMLAAYPSLRVDQGAGVLAAMGAINMIASPAPLQSKFTNADGSMLITLRAVQKNVVNGGDYNFEYPVVVPLQEPMALKASEVTDQLAQACGYRNAEVMLKAKGNPEFLHFYTFREYLLGEVPLYEEAGGKHHIDFMHGANNAWLNSSDTSIKYAREYLDSLPEAERTQHIVKITNRRHIHEVDPNAPPPLMKRNGNGPLPADTESYWRLRAREGSNHAAMVIGDHQPDAVAAALAAKQQAAQDADAANHAKQKAHAGGEGWSVLTARASSAERYGKTRQEQR